MTPAQALPAGITVFERGWLSANNIFFRGREGTALVDSGYCTHSGQTVALVDAALGGRPLDVLLNTHLHSDHCGGNAALQQRHPLLRTLIPPGLSAQVRHWDPVALTYEPTGQQCPRFQATGLLQAGSEIQLGDRLWQVHAAPGHDPDSIILFETQSRILISADALWENGFGVVFEELEGQRAFDAVAHTLNLIESLRPSLIIPGHGNMFFNMEAALTAARRRLDGFVKDPSRHATHAAKVLLKFKLLEWQRIRRQEFAKWAETTPYFTLVHDRWFSETELSTWIERLCDELVRAGVAWQDDEWIANA